MSNALLVDINWVTVAQVSRSHSPVFDLAVRHLDENVVESSTICGTLLTVNWWMATFNTN